MVNGSGVSRGDRNRNARLERLRVLVPLENAVVGIDLADKKQMVVVTDHDSKVLARKTFRCRAWDLGIALGWAAERAKTRGFAGVTVACEPTGHRWRVLGQLAADRRMPFGCVQPMVTSWARRAEDLTFDKTDEKDAVLIARLTAQLRCYVPEPVVRPGAGCGIWVPAASSSSSRRSARSSRCATSSNASGRRRWTPPSNRSGPAPGPRRCG
jgi:transposase